MPRRWICWWTRSGGLAPLTTRTTVISGDRSPGASGPTDVDPVSQRGSLVPRGRRSTRSHLQGCARVVDRWHPARHGSEQRTIGHPSLVGSRGGGGKRDYPRPNAGQSRGPFHSYLTTFLLVGCPHEPSARCGHPTSKTWAKKAGISAYGLDGRGDGVTDEFVVLTSHIRATACQTKWLVAETAGETTTLAARGLRAAKTEKGRPRSIRRAKRGGSQDRTE